MTCESLPDYAKFVYPGMWISVKSLLYLSCASSSHSSSRCASYVCPGFCRWMCSVVCDVCVKCVLSSKASCHSFLFFVGRNVKCGGYTFPQGLDYQQQRLDLLPLALTFLLTQPTHPTYPPSHHRPSVLPTSSLPPPSLSLSHGRVKKHRREGTQFCFCLHKFLLHAFPRCLTRSWSMRASHTPHRHTRTIHTHTLTHTEHPRTRTHTHTHTHTHRMLNVVPLF